MSPKMLLSAVVTEIVIISLLGDATPASAAAVVSTSAARHRRQLAGSADHPTVDGVEQDGPSRSHLLRAWLRAAAARQRSRDAADEDYDGVWKRKIDYDDIYLVRRRADWNKDDDLDLIRTNSVSRTQEFQLIF